MKRGCANYFFREVMRIYFLCNFFEGVTARGSGSEDERRERVGGRREGEGEREEGEREREERRVRRQSFSIECDEA